jgi:hypothetical protein
MYMFFENIWKPVLRNLGFKNILHFTVTVTYNIPQIWKYGGACTIAQNKLKFNLSLTRLKCDQKSLG